jgi:hypothetical protein
MKIKQEHYEHMRVHVEQVLHTFPTPAEYADWGLGKDPAKRHRWDAFYKAGLVPYACSTIYPYADDHHLDTALAFIVRRFYKARES